MGRTLAYFGTVMEGSPVHYCPLGWQSDAIMTLITACCVSTLEQSQKVCIWGEVCPAFSCSPGDSGGTEVDALGPAWGSAPRGAEVKARQPIAKAFTNRQPILRLMTTQKNVC